MDGVFSSSVFPFSVFGVRYVVIQVLNTGFFFLLFFSQVLMIYQQMIRNILSSKMDHLRGMFTKGSAIAMSFETCMLMEGYRLKNVQHLNLDDTTGAPLVHSFSGHSSPNGV